LLIPVVLLAIIHLNICLFSYIGLWHIYIVNTGLGLDRTLDWILDLKFSFWRKILALIAIIIRLISTVAFFIRT
jgi:hypothetical protein